MHHRCQISQIRHIIAFAAEQTLTTHDNKINIKMQRLGFFYANEKRSSETKLFLLIIHSKLSILLSCVELFAGRC